MLLFRITAVVLAITSISNAQATITAAEYFTGNDPGGGNGTSISASDGSFDSSTESVSLSINTSEMDLVPDGLM